MRSEESLDGEELLVLARLDLEQGRVEAGLIKLKRATFQAGSPAEVRVELARVYAQLGLRKKALPNFKAYLEKHPADVDALFQMGMVHFEEKEIEPALVLWDQLLKQVAGYPPALFFRAAAALQMGKQAEARQQLKALMQQVAPDNLYFTKAGELLRSLESSDKSEGVRVIAPANAYRTEH